jgi:hypothetical protein
MKGDLLAKAAALVRRAERVLAEGDESDAELEAQLQTLKAQMEIYLNAARLPPKANGAMSEGAR